MTKGYSLGEGGEVCFLGGGMISGRLASGDQKLTLEVVPLPPPPLRGGTPLYKPCIYPPSSTGLVFGPVWSEKGYRLYSWTYLSFQFQMNKKENWGNARIQVDFKKSLLLAFYVYCHVISSTCAAHLTVIDSLNRFVSGWKRYPPITRLTCIRCNIEPDIFLFF